MANITTFMERAGGLHPGCWSHARRRPIDVARGGDKVGLAALRLISPLFFVEEQSALDCHDEAQRLARRAEHNALAVKRRRVWLEDKRATCRRGRRAALRSATSTASGSVSYSSSAMEASS